MMNFLLRRFCCSKIPERRFEFKIFSQRASGSETLSPFVKQKAPQEISRLKMKIMTWNMIFLFLPVLFFCSVFSVQPVFAQEKDKRYKSLKTLLDVLHTIETSYVRELPPEQLIQGAIKGMIGELDTHSHFLPTEQLKTFKKQSKGRFSGFGMELAIRNKKIIIISVLENSPASKAGIKKGHILLQINQQKTADLNKAEIYKLLKTRRGQKINITLKAPKLNKIRQVQLRSEMISVQSVSHKDLGDQSLYIRINHFTERTSREIRKIMDTYQKESHGKNNSVCKMERQAAKDKSERSHAISNPEGKQKSDPFCKKIASLILDIRSNPGGLFESAIKVADLFIERGDIVHIKGRLKEHEQKFKAHSPGTLPYFPMLVLIDSYSASSAEILAGALKENKRALLLGRKSWGKGSVQSLIPVNNGNAVKLTVAHYYTPMGNSIHEKGVQPHVELKQPVFSDESKDLLLTGPEDTDFQQALSFLKMFKHFMPTRFSDFAPPGAAKRENTDQKSEK